MVHYVSVLLTSIVRAPYIQILEESDDFSLKQAEAGVWSIVELNLGIVCANLMRMKPLLRRYLPVFLEKRGFSSGKDSRRQEDSSSRGSGPGGRGNASTASGCTAWIFRSRNHSRRIRKAGTVCVQRAQGDGSTEHILRR